MSSLAEPSPSRRRVRAALVGACLVIWLLLGLALAPPAGAEEPPPATESAAAAFKPGLLVNVRAIAVQGSSAGIEVQRVRPSVRGDLLDGSVGYVVQAEFAGAAPSLLDAAVAWRPGAGVSLQVGRFLVPYTRAQLTPVPKLQFQGFAPSVNGERHGRDLGLQARLDRGPLDVRVGVFQSAVAFGEHPLVVGRASVDLIGDVPLDEGDVAVRPEGGNGLSVGGSARYGGDVRKDGDVLDSTGGAADLAARLGPTRWQAEACYRRWEDGVDQVGGYVQGSVRPVERLEIGSRVDLWHVEADTWTVQGLVSYYADGHHARVSLEGQTAWGDGVESSWFIALQPQVWI